MNLFGLVDGSLAARDIGCWLIPPFEFRATEAPPPAAVTGLPYQMLVASIVQRLQAEVGDTYGIAVQTISPAPDDAEQYLECQVSLLDALPRRHALQENFLRCRLRVSCWSRSRTILGMAGELSDGIVAALERKTIPIRDYRDQEVPLWGYVKFREAERTDFSRQALRELSRVRRYFEVQVEGIAERTW